MVFKSDPVCLPVTSECIQNPSTTPSAGDRLIDRASGKERVSDICIQTPNIVSRGDSPANFKR